MLLINYWYVKLDEDSTHSNNLITMWCDADGNQASNNVSIYPGEDDVKRYDRMTPQAGQRMELRTEPCGIGGWILNGYVDFDYVG